MHKNDPFLTKAFFLFSNWSRILASSCASFFGVNVFSRIEVLRTDCVRVLEWARRICGVTSCGCEMLAWHAFDKSKSMNSRDGYAEKYV